MNSKNFIKILGTITCLAGIILIFFNWKLGLTLLIVWLFLTASILVWLTDDSVPDKTSQEVAQHVRQTIGKAKKRAILFTIIEGIILALIWII